MIKNKTGFVGIGGYAGNQLLPFYKKNYPCLFINSAHQDLDSLKEVDESDKYHIPGGEGCNKNRKKSKELFRKDIDNIVNAVKEKFPGIEYLFVAAALGGGTGAGGVAALKKIVMEELDLKACGTITVLSKMDWDKPIGRDNVFSLMWDYCNEDLERILGEYMCLISDLHKKKTGKGFAEVFSEMYNIPSYSINKDAGLIQDNQTGEIIKIDSKKQSHIKIVK